MFKEVYTYNEESNEYIGETITMLDPEETRMQGKDVWMMPPNSTELKPEFREGYAPIWNGESWDYVEDHRGEKGWVNRAPIEIKKLGPLPDNFSVKEPVPTSKELAEQRRKEILAELNLIDLASSRSIRAILTAQGSGQEPDAVDVERLAGYEASAKALRVELSGLEF